MSPRPAMIPLALYAHLPWCARKCPYCDFNSHAVGDALPERRYVQALLRDLEGELPRCAGRSLRSIFIGGGTPSLFSARAIGALLDGVGAGISCAPAIEISLEANPGTAEQERFAGYRTAGVNRLSIGAQSFNDRSLQSLGRIHDGAQAERALKAARAAGFDNINLDLMHGLPGQTVAEAASDLRRAIALQPTQISWYQLTIEKNTVFYRRPPKLPAEDALAAIQEEGERLLQEAGYRQYEVSAWALAGGECRHNLNYWEFGDYLGIGAGAHGKYSENNAINDQYDAKIRDIDDEKDINSGSDDDKCAVQHRSYKEMSVNAEPVQENAENGSDQAIQTAGTEEADGDESPSLSVLRTEKARIPERYMEHFSDGAPPSGGVRQWTAPREELPLEFMMNALRLKRGCASALFEARTGLPLSTIEAPLRQLRERGLLAREQGRIRPTALGYRFLDEALQAFAPAEETPRPVIICAPPGARSSAG